jgi:hypothetical protein
MNRYNLFHKIHKGLRALLYDTGMLLQRTDFTMENEAQEAIGRVQFVVALFDQFQQSEDTVVLPAITGYEAGVIQAFDQEHEETYLLGRKLERLVNDFTETSLPLEKVAVSAELLATFEEYTLIHILHMAREELVVNKFLWRYYTDGELQKIAWKMTNDPDSPFSALYNKWIFRGLNNNEIVRWLKEAKHSADRTEFESLLKTAEAELHPHRWSLLQDVLATGIFLAR